MIGTSGVILPLTFVLLIVSLTVFGVVFTLVLYIYRLFKKKPKLTSNALCLYSSGKDGQESESTYEDVRKVSPQMETNLVHNISYGRALKHNQT